MFWWFSCKILTNKTYFIYSSFPTFSFSFSWTNYLKHLCLGHRFYFINWYTPFTSFLFSFLFYHICQYFWIFLLFSIHQICRNCTLFNWFHFPFSIFLLIFLNRFFHLYFLFKAILIEYFSFDSSECLCFLWYHLGLSGLFLSLFFFGIQSLAKTTLVKLHVIILWHEDGLLMIISYYYGYKQF
jgi:hypothetical protein